MNYPKYLLKIPEFIEWAFINVDCPQRLLQVIKTYSEVMHQPKFLGMFVAVSNTGTFVRLEWTGKHLPADKKEREQAYRDIEYFKSRDALKWFNGFSVVNKSVLHGARYYKHDTRIRSHGYLIKGRLLISEDAETLEEITLLKGIEPIECTQYFWEHVIFELY
jgi:hypothetical protein